MKKRTLPFSPWLAKLSVTMGLAAFAAGCNQKDLVEPSLSVSLHQDAKKEKSKTFYGPASPMGQGVARL
jgi:hypothetical protein